MTVMLNSQLKLDTDLSAFTDPTPTVLCVQFQGSPFIWRASGVSPEGVTFIACVHSMACTGAIRLSG